MVAILFGGGYWFYVAEAVCDVPISYHIGTIDPRFNISEEEVRNAVSVGESMWEDATGRNLFTYDEKGTLAINFVFDERQEKANEEKKLLEVLEKKEGASETVHTQYETLLSEYGELKAQYEKRTATYENNLAAYNKEVSDWNKKEGAPKDVYERLTATQHALGSEQEKLNGIAAQLNELVRKMNSIGAKGNTLNTDYNQVVEEYNTKVGEGGEFTQGDYAQKNINIYQYDTQDELEIVLAHELGHALSLDHVEGSTSIMYQLMEAQSKTTGITESDLSAFEKICGTETSFFEVFRELARRTFS